MLSSLQLALVEYCNISEFEELYDRTVSRAYAEAYSILRDEMLAEDCVSEVFLSVAKNLDTVRALPQKKQLCYIIICVRNKAADMLKKNKPELSSGLLDEASLSFEGADYSLVEWKECLAKLPRTDTEILYLRYILGLDYKQISASLGISRGAARVRLFTAKAHLKELFGKEVP